MTTPITSFAGMEIERLPSDAVKDALILFLRKSFEDHPNYRYKTDPNDTKLDIFDEWSHNREAVGRKPALVVSRGGMRHIKLGIHNSLFAMRLAKNAKHHIAVVEAGIRVSCLADTPLGSEILGSEVFTLLRNRKLDFMELSGAHEMQVSVLSPRTPVQVNATATLTDTPVDLSIQFVEQWTHRRTDEPVLAGVNLKESEEEVDC